MIRASTQCLSSVPIIDHTFKSKRILIGQLGSFGDCLYATTVAYQIKTDFPECHLTWAIGSLYRSILDNNPHVDEIWEVPLTDRSDLLTHWLRFENEALERKKKGEFDEIYFTQVFPNNIKFFDGTLRASLFRAYPRPITVPIAPILRLSLAEVEKVRLFAEQHRLADKKHVILFECSFKSGQSFITQDFALKVAHHFTDTTPDACIILSSDVPLQINDSRIIDGSKLSFRENAELTKYCTLLIGCSSGISWLSTSDWANPLPMIQLLKKRTSMYASFVQDFEYHGFQTDSIIEITDCEPDKLVNCLRLYVKHGFKIARHKYHERLPLKFNGYCGALSFFLLEKGKFADAVTSIMHTMRRYGLHPNLLLSCIVIIIKYCINLPFLKPIK